MKTAFILMAQYDGLAVIPVDVVCRYYFRHLTVEKFLRKTLAGEIALPVVRMEGEPDKYGVDLLELAFYIDSRSQAARDEQQDRERLQAAIEEALSGPQPTTTVYFIGCGNRVKIGRSGDVRRRLQTLATSHFEDLTILATIDDAPVGLEWRLQDRFVADHIRREWFWLSDEIQSCIDRIKAGGAP